MAFFYTHRKQQTTNRTSFVAAAVREVFRSRDLRLANEPDFVDRLQGDRPQRLDHAAAEVVEDLGRLALAHWLSAAQTEDREERQAALAIAAEIARLAGLPFEESSGEQAA